MLLRITGAKWYLIAQLDVFDFFRVIKLESVDNTFLYHFFVVALGYFGFDLIGLFGPVSVDELVWVIDLK